MTKTLKVLSITFFTLVLILVLMVVYYKYFSFNSFFDPVDEAITWEELLDNHSVTFIEWPQIIEPLLDRYYKLKITVDGQKRQFDLLRKNRNSV